MIKFNQFAVTEDIVLCKHCKAGVHKDMTENSEQWKELKAAFLEQHEDSCYKDKHN